MKKESKRILCLFLFGILMISFLGGVVSAAEFNPLTGLKDSFYTLFTDWKEGKASANTAKVIFFVILVLGLYLLFSSTFGEFGKSHTGSLIVLSILISFLLIAYVAPEEIYSVLISYTALGLTLITLIPLGILSLISWQAAASGKPQIMILQWVGWYAYAFYLGYRLVLDWVVLHEGYWISNGIILCIAIFTIIMALFNKQILRMVAIKYIEAVHEKASSSTESATAMIKNLERMERTLGK
ncbi:MAG: hypothetical protein KKF68_03050 [Nanoarchaeota archaeon]|nr:hypothetical protein [Nanoarchaeota archaeon]